MPPSDPTLRNRARQLRKRLTTAEQLLWRRLRRRQILGVQFNRQKVIAGYIVDFYAFRAGLVIEIDGGSTGTPSTWNVTRSGTGVSGGWG